MLFRSPVQRFIATDTWHHGGHGNRITRADALDIAIQYLSRRLRASLGTYESWLPSPADDDKSMQAFVARIPVLDGSDLPGVEGADTPGTERAPGAPLNREFRAIVRFDPFEPPWRQTVSEASVSPIEPEPNGRPAWKVTVPGDFGRAMGVGSTRTITIDATNGVILSDRDEGE